MAHSAGFPDWDDGRYVPPCAVGFSDGEGRGLIMNDDEEEDAGPRWLDDPDAMAFNASSYQEAELV